jgi:hypothetical protein
LKPEKEIFDEIEFVLTQKLDIASFYLSKTEYHKEYFGSRYTVWKNEREKFALRLTWDGKESWFILEESSFEESQEPTSWTDLIIVRFDRNIDNSQYFTEIIDAVINELK